MGYLLSAEAAPGDAAVERWLAELERRHLANLTIGEAARALRALSSCYVERRGKLAEGGALASAGKRAAFALFYGPMHFLVTREIVQSLSTPIGRVRDIIDVGCGSGAAGAAWAIASGAPRILGIDRHPWAVAEANWTYRQFDLGGRAVQRDLTRTTPKVSAGTGVISAYVINELTAPARDSAMTALLAAHEQGARVLVIEPIARSLTPWWNAWRTAFESAGGRADEWRFQAAFGSTQQTLARAAGLDPRELTARSLLL